VKILVTIHELASFAGSQTATLALAPALRASGHEVTLAAGLLGAASEALERANFRVVDDLRRLADLELDVIHAQHCPMALLARGVFPRTPMVFHGHGVLPALERPPSIDLGIGGYIAVSEEVRDLWRAEHGIQDADVIRNGVDTVRFSPRGRIAPRPRRVLVITNRMAPERRELVRRACSILRARVAFIGMVARPVRNVEDRINEADVVVSLGRGIIEAMACGRAAFVYDVHGGDGYVTPETYETLRRVNFSGRSSRREFTAEELAEELSRYSARMGDANRELALAHHDIARLVPEYEAAYRKAIGRGAGAGAAEVPVRELSALYEEWRALAAFESRYRAFAARPFVRALKTLWRLAGFGRPF